VVFDPPTLTCPSPIAAATTSASGIVATYTTPEASGGEAPVSVACTPASGSTFAVGATTVTCTATDKQNRTGSCSFPVTVSRTPQLSVTKFMAFGDSITAGEVTFPVSGGTTLGGPNYKLVVLPAAAYPAVLRSLMTARYTTQTSAIVLTNQGLPGEAVRNPDTLPRFAQAMSSERPNIVLLMEGYNDIGDPTVLTATAEGINRMCAEARNRGARVFLATLAPSRPGFRAIPQSSVQAYNDRLREVARGENAVVVDIYAALLPQVSVNIGADGLHPTEIGYRRIAETFLAAIQSNLEVR
jgi:lysophospholipase L1-like esterase